jgi:hypothetical protein
MADRREFFQEVARAGGRSLIDLLGLAVRVTENPAAALGRLVGERSADRTPALPRSLELPATADLWRWPGAPSPFPADAGPAGQRLTPREIPPRRVLFEDMALPGDAWLVLPASLAALCRWEERVRVVAVAGAEHLALHPHGIALDGIHRIGVAVGSGHEAWVRAAWRERGMPEPEVVAAEPAALAMLQRDGRVDALFVEGPDGRGVPAWALAAPEAWPLPADWASALSPGWRRGPGSQLRWLYTQLHA